MVFAVDPNSMMQDDGTMTRPPRAPEPPPPTGEQPPSPADAHSPTAPDGGGAPIAIEPQAMIGEQQTSRRPSGALLNALIMTESGGRADAVSPKGARGPAQIMPHTARDPGFGVKPVSNPHDPVEARRFAGDYLGALIAKYGDPDQALMAYNMGPGRMDRWLKSGANPDHLPSETRQYVAKVRGRLGDGSLFDEPAMPDSAPSEVGEKIDTPAAAPGSRFAVQAQKRRDAAAPPPADQSLIPWVRDAQPPQAAQPPAPAEEPKLPEMTVEVPGHGQVKFPAGMTQRQIAKAIYDNFPDMRQSAPAAFGNAVGQGAVGAASTAIEGLNALLAKPEWNRFEVRRLAQLYQTLQPEDRQRLRAEVDKRYANRPDVRRSALFDAFRDIDAGQDAQAPEQPMPLSERRLSRIAQQIERGNQIMFPVQPEQQDKWYVQFGQGLGSTAALIPFALVPGAGGTAAGYIAGGLMGSGEAAQRAQRAGASDEQIITAAYQGIAPGAVDFMPIDRFAQQWTRNPGLRAWLYGVAKRSAAQAGFEGSTEAIQQIMQNMIAKANYKPDQELTEDVIQNFLLGAAVGSTFGPAGRFDVRVPAISPMDEPAAAAQQTLPPAEPSAEPVSEPAGLESAAAPETGPARDTGTGLRAALDEARGEQEPTPAQAALAEAQQSRIEGALGRAMLDTGQSVRFTDPATGEVTTGKVHAYDLTPDGKASISIVDEQNNEIFYGDPDTAQVAALSGDGTKAAPLAVESAADADIAARNVAEPTDGQMEAGNYQHGHVTWNGLDIAIETPKGGTRRAADGSWIVPDFPAHYGYVKRSEGSDGDQVDVYMGPEPKAERVFVVDQIDPETGKFDEHKSMLGFPDKQAAIRAYRDAFSDGSGLSRAGAVTEMSVDEFKTWLRDGDTTMPVEYEAPKVKALPADAELKADHTQTFDVVEPDPAIKKSLLRIAKRINPSVGVEFVDRILAPSGPAEASGIEPGGEAAGLYSAMHNLILIAKAGQNTETAYHELFHSVDDLLTPQEQKIVYESAKTRAKHGNTDRERAAYAFGAWASGREKYDDAPKMVRAFQKLKAFIQRVISFLKGQGVTTMEDVFEKVYRGGAKPKAEPRFDPAGLAFSRLPDRTVADALSEINRPLWDRIRRGASIQVIKTTLDRIRHYIQDRMLTMRRYQEDIQKRGGRVTPAQDVYGAEELFSGRAGAKLRDLQQNHVEPLVEFMAEHGIALDNLNLYLYARHARERNARIAEINPDMPDGGSGMTNEQADQVMADFMHRGMAARLEEAAQRVDAINRLNLKERVQAGLMTQEQATEWQTRYPHWVPLRGFSELDPDEGASSMPRIGRGFDVRGSESRAALGRESLAADIVPNAIMLAEEGIIRGEKNRVGVSLYNLVRAHPDPEVWEIWRGQTRQVLDPATGQVREYWSQQPPPAVSDRSIAVKIGGKEALIVLHDERLLRTMKTLNVENANIVLRLLMLAGRYFSQINTSYNPEFIIVNALRDLETGTINIQAQNQQGVAREIWANYTKALRGSFRGLRNVNTADPWRRYFLEFERAGGKVSFYKIDDLNERRANLQRDLQRAAQGPFNAARLARETKRLVEDANAAVDNAMRLATFVALRNRGYSSEQAASVAKNLTVNFNRRGEIGHTINALYVFFNAGIQGTFTLLKAFRRSRKVQAITGGIVVAGALLDFLNSLLSDQDDDGELFYDKISAYDKSRNMIMMVPGAKGDFVKIPMAYGYNAFFDLGRNIAAIGRGKQSVAKGMANTLGTAADAFNPLGGGHSFLNLLAPTLIDPVVDIWMNRSFFGRPINPTQNPFQAQGPNSENAYPQTSPSAKAVARFMNWATGGDEYTKGLVDVNPGSIEYAFQQYLGAAGQFVQRSAELPVKIVQGQEIRWNDIPFARRVVGETGVWSDRSLAYDRIKEVEDAARRIKASDAGDDRAAYERAEKDVGWQAEMAGAAKQLRKDLSAIRKERNEINADPKLTPRQKQQKLKLLEADEKEKLVEWNRDFNAAEKAHKSK